MKCYSSSKDSFPGNLPRIKIIPITESEIKSILHSLKPNKLSGYDEITSKIIKTHSSLIWHPLSYIYNHSLCTGIFPDYLKSYRSKITLQEKETKLV